MALLDEVIRGVRSLGLTVKKRTATGASLAATCHGFAGKVTTEALTTAGVTDIAYVITNNKVVADSIVDCTLEEGTNTDGSPVILNVTPAAGSFTVNIRNAHATAALNGTLKIAFVVH